MKTRTLLLICFFLFNCQRQEQNIILKYPYKVEDDIPIPTEKFLKELNWENVIEYSQDHEKHYTNTNYYSFFDTDTLIKRYSYNHKNHQIYFELKSYNKEVLSFEAHQDSKIKENKISYFDKIVWKKYLKDKLPELPPKYHINIDEEPREIFEAYYKLVGLNSYDEYGWICEYSTIGMPPGKRQGTLKLAEFSRKDLLLKLFDYPNNQTKMYIIDALIYLDYKANDQIRFYNKYEIFEGDQIDTLSKLLLTEKEKKEINQFINSSNVIKTCGNAGSFKIYPKNSDELWGDEFHNQIIEKYEEIERIGQLNWRYL